MDSAAGALFEQATATDSYYLRRLGNYLTCFLCGARGDVDKWGGVDTMAPSLEIAWSSGYCNERPAATRNESLATSSVEAWHPLTENHTCRK